MNTRNSSAHNKGKAKTKPGMTRGIDDALVDHNNDT